MWHWRRFRSTLGVGYLCGAALGAAAALMFIGPIDFMSGLATAAVGSGVGALAVTFAVFGGWAMLTWRDARGSLPSDRRVVVAATGAGLGVFTGSVLVGLSFMPEQFVLYITFATLSGIFTVIISSLFISAAEHQASSAGPERDPYRRSR